MSPTELFAEIADKITLIVKQPYRTEPVTQQEWDAIRDSIITLEVVNGDTGSASKSGSLSTVK